jgi:hypothetical protein
LLNHIEIQLIGLREFKKESARENFVFSFRISAGALNLC